MISLYWLYTRHKSKKQCLCLEGVFKMVFSFTHMLTECSNAYRIRSKHWPMQKDSRKVSSAFQNLADLSPEYNKSFLFQSHTNMHFLRTPLWSAWNELV